MSVATKRRLDGVRCRSAGRKMKISIPTALKCERHVEGVRRGGVSIDAFGAVDTFCSPVPCQLSQLTCPPSFYFISVGFVFALGGTPVAPPPRAISTYAPLRLLSRPLLVSFRALARVVRSSSHFVLITSHRQGVYGLSASLGIHTTQLLIALPISARARSRSTPPARLCSHRNTCPIINSHDPPIIGGISWSMGLAPF